MPAPRIKSQPQQTAEMPIIWSPPPQQQEPIYPEPVQEAKKEDKPTFIQKLFGQKTFGQKTNNLVKKEIFNKDVEDPEQRIRRIEVAVASLSHDINILINKIDSLAEDATQKQHSIAAPQAASPVTTHSTTQTAVPAPIQFGGPPRKLPSGPPAQLVPQAYIPAPTPVPTRTTAPKPPELPAIVQIFKTPKTKSGEKAHPAQAYVKQLRVGEHGAKTRVVLDIVGPAQYRYDLDNTENLLVIELLNTSWEADLSQNFLRSPRLISYKIQKSLSGDNSSRLIMLLRKPINILYDGELPSQDKTFNRIVFDIIG